MKNYEEKLKDSPLIEQIEYILNDGMGNNISAIETGLLVLNNLIINTVAYNNVKDIIDNTFSAIEQFKQNKVLINKLIGKEKNNGL